MASQSQSLRQVNELGLQQVLSPLQVQYARMLEMTGPEIEEEVARVLDENPAVEIADEVTRDFDETADELQRADYGRDEEVPFYRTATRNYGPDDDHRQFQIADHSRSLIDDLDSQLGEMHLSELERRIADEIVGNLDDNGYLGRDPVAIADDLAFNAGLEVSADEVKRVLGIVRTLDPPGIGAYDLRDCLLLQLKRRSTDASRLATEIVRDYFDLFSKKHYDRLLSALSIDHHQLKEALDCIRSLNPKPGGQVSAEVERSIIPDFSVENDGGALTLSLLHHIPSLSISRSFDGDEHPETSRRDDESRWIRQRRNEGSQFIQSLSMRQATLYRVMEAIVKHQRDFFTSGDPARLRPMILKDIAAATGYDISVISRATAGKYVATHSGVYPLKYFFNERPKADDDELTRPLILKAIKDVIDNENPLKPLSDEAITARIAEAGYDIARRTVAKYRERMGYPVARLRKKL